MAHRVYIETTFISYLTARPSRDVVVAGHLANATMRAQIEAVCASKGYKAPIICTPEELMEAKP